MTIKVTWCATLIWLSVCVALPARAQTPAQSQSVPETTEAVSLAQRAIFDVAPITGTLKETVQKSQQLVWVGKAPNDRRFQITNVSVAFLRNEGGGDVKMTFAGEVSSLGYRPVDEAKLTVIVRTKSGASIHFWNFSISVRCADKDRPLPPLTHQVPSDIANNVFTSIGSVEIADYREPNQPRTMVRRCPS